MMASSGAKGKGGLLRMQGKIKDLAIVFALFSAILGLIVVMAKFTETKLQGEVEVIDGDSLKMGGDEIRLFGMDAPEYRQECQKDGGGTYPCGQLARDYLAGLVQSGNVTCSGFERDKYDRLLAICKVGEREINAEMVSAGWAVVFGDYGTEEAKARASKVGIWVGEFQNPADWRKDASQSHKRSFLSSISGW